MLKNTFTNDPKSFTVCTENNGIESAQSHTSGDSNSLNFKFLHQRPFSEKILKYHVFKYYKIIISAAASYLINYFLIFMRSI